MNSVSLRSTIWSERLLTKSERAFTTLWIWISKKSITDSIRRPFSLIFCVHLNRRFFPPNKPNFSGNEKKSNISRFLQLDYLWKQYAYPIVTLKFPPSKRVSRYLRTKIIKWYWTWLVLCGISQNFNHIFTHFLFDFVQLQEYMNRWAFVISVLLHTNK